MLDGWILPYVVYWHGSLFFFFWSHDMAAQAESSLTNSTDGLMEVLVSLSLSLSFFPSLCMYLHSTLYCTVHCTRYIGILVLYPLLLSGKMAF